MQRKWYSCIIDYMETHKKIRSFVKRTGRLTKGQERALTELLPQFQFSLQDGKLDYQRLFERTAPVILEIGFGMGDSLVTMAVQNPQNDYLGIEVHTPGVGSLLLGVEEHQLSNIRVSQDDAVEVLANNIPNNSLTGVQLFFPDPWHKTRHHKRRIVQLEFVELLQQKLIVGGFFHMATDWQNYAEHMLEVMSNAPGFENCAEHGYLPRPDSRPITKFEKRGHRLGHGIWDLMFKKVL